eukprot:m.7199 g.7199  ORF g.7199 m.7199 type:complete len:604 (-) comp2728_c0_seq1:247-2058(-)
MFSVKSFGRLLGLRQSASSSFSLSLSPLVSLLRQQQVSHLSTSNTVATAEAVATNIDVDEVIAPTPFMAMAMDIRLKEALVQDFKYELASPIQEMCFETCMKEQNVVLKSKTGSGKTIAFLLPIIHKHFREARKILKSKPSRVPILIITPTRELAKQVEVEGAKLLNRFPRELVTDSCIGGTPRGLSMKRMVRRPPFIMAATPGRLLDMMETCGWENTFDDLKVLVLDEADRLLDMGFRTELEAIITKLNASEKSKERQTIILSATMDEDVEAVEQLAFNGASTPVLVNVPHGEGGVETTDSVTQYHHEASLENLFPSLHAIIHSHTQQQMKNKQNSKIVVFFNTTAQAQFFSEVFSRDKYKLYTLHSKMQQSKRDRIRGTFKVVDKGVLFTTDVSARGVDYPDVSLVIQVGVPRDRETYIHRIGRTGRGTKTGSSVLVTTPEERPFINKHLSDFPMSPMAMEVDDDDIMFGPSKAFLKQRFEFLREYDGEKGEETFTPFIGFYRSILSDLNMTTSQLVDFAEKYSTSCILLDSAPTLSGKMMQQLGLNSKNGRGKNRVGKHQRLGMPKQYSGHSLRARQPRKPSSYSNGPSNNKQKYTKQKY